MNITKICAHIATLGPIGYILAPGTIASAIALPFVFAIQNKFGNLTNYSLFLILFFFIGRLIVNKARDYFGRNHDPSEIVLDEVIGCFFIFWGISFSTPVALFGFLLFRFFDISKIGGVGYFEKFNNGWGIMLDDVMAGIISNIILRILL